MKCRPVDEFGDMMPIKSKSEMWEGVEAVSQAIRSRIRMTIGEWWENETLGFEIPAFLIEGMKENSCDMLTGYVVAYIMQTPEVETLVSQDYEFNNRELTVDVVVSLTNGEEIEGSVTMDELLRAVS